MSYSVLRTIHLLSGVLAAPMLVMYGLSAVQMAHSGWFSTKPSVDQFEATLSPSKGDGRAVAREFMQKAAVVGEIQDVRATPTGFSVRIVVPGTVHEIVYESASGRARVKRGVSGVWGTMNRLHHAAGLWHSYWPLQLWGALCAIISLATVVLGATGLWMWWLRRQERSLGIVLLAANIAFSVGIIVWLRIYGP
jgi:hypothetical protein